MLICGYSRSDNTPGCAEKKLSYRTFLSHVKFACKTWFYYRSMITKKKHSMVFSNSFDDSVICLNRRVQVVLKTVNVQVCHT